MPTQIYQVTSAPVNLIGAADINGDPLALEVGKTYQARFVAIGVQSILKALEVAHGTPAFTASPALPVRVFEDLVISPKAGLSIFVWSEDAGTMVINDIS